MPGFVLSMTLKCFCQLASSTTSWQTWQSKATISCVRIEVKMKTSSLRLWHLGTLCWRICIVTIWTLAANPCTSLCSVLMPVFIMLFSDFVLVPVEYHPIKLRGTLTSAGAVTGAGPLWLGSNPCSKWFTGPGLGIGGSNLRSGMNCRSPRP